MLKNSSASAGGTGDLGSIPGLGRSPGGGHSNPLQYSCLEKPVERGAWWATVHGVAKSRAWLSKLSCTHLQRFFEKSLHSYKVFMVRDTKARAVSECELWDNRDWVCFPPHLSSALSMFHPEQELKEWRKNTVNYSLKLHSIPIIDRLTLTLLSETPVPSRLSAWNGAQKTYILFNESVNDSSNQFNLAYAFLVRVPINYQLPVFTFQCLTIFCWLL